MDPLDILALNPINFFQLVTDCHQIKAPPAEDFAITSRDFDKYKLPLTTAISGDPLLASIALAWRKDGLEAFIKVDRPYTKAFYPDIIKGDSVELFIDTRDIKTSGHNTRFCHHFFFLPERIDGRQSGEITRFRTEDAHELCHSEELKSKIQIKKYNYSLQIFIPAACLQGYDPDQFSRLGFTYRINHQGESQHFSVVTAEYQLEQQPSLWSSLKLVP